ncbi:hypothetical protein EG68_07195 [Paragonimus skrjabini miyazakii]|uniref:Uncharacterized protein n=1 Tax=Paragonimus skrjabini miyazakii TaxID=59628 RepID=A0A8S9YKU2_9TREM|nr:hypothetical protein EG68_07195 [Paragonimus skrjabini miyazakii]
MERTPRTQPLKHQHHQHQRQQQNLNPQQPPVRQPARTIQAQLVSNKLNREYQPRLSSQTAHFNVSIMNSLGNN